MRVGHLVKLAMRQPGKTGVHLWTYLVAPGTTEKTAAIPRAGRLAKKQQTGTTSNGPIRKARHS
jgi:hypothetical protein